MVDEKKTLYCNFCGKSQHEVKLIAGPTVFICYECVDLCHAIRTEGTNPPPKGENYIYRVSHPVLTVHDTHRDFDSLDDALTFDQDWRKKEEDFLFRYRMRLVKSNIAKVLEKKLYG